MKRSDEELGGCRAGRATPNAICHALANGRRGARPSRSVHGFKTPTRDTRAPQPGNAVSGLEARIERRETTSPRPDHG